MKREKKPVRWGFLLLLLLLLPSVGQGREITVVRYEVKGFQKGDTLLLRWGLTGQTVSPLIGTFDATVHKADTLILDEPRLLFLSLKGRPGVLELLVGPGETVVVSGRLPRGYASRYRTFSIGDLHVTGAEMQQEYTSLISHFERYRDSLSRVPVGYEEISRRYNEALAVGDLDALARLRGGTYEEQNYIQMLSSRRTDVVRYLMDIVLSYRDTYMAPLLMLRLFERVDERLRPLYQRLLTEAKQTYYGQLVRRAVLPKIHHVRIAPPLPVVDTDLRGDTLHFSPHEPRLTLVAFWATYCAPCLKHFPVLKTLYEKYHRRGLDIVTVSTDERAEEWQRKLSELHLPWTTNFFDDRHLAPDLFHFSTIPYTLLIDPDGMIVAVDLHGVELVEYIETLF